MMRNMSMVAVLFPALVGCGEPPITAGFSASISWAEITLDCAPEPAALADMSAELWIGGSKDEPCELHVDSATHFVDGTCSKINPEIVRPLLLHYFIPNSAGSNYSLLLCLGYVDLRSESVPADASADIDITLCDGTGSPMIYEESAIAELPLWDSAETDPMETARMWARFMYSYKAFNGVLDSDGDDCPNLVELCNDTLDDVGNTGC